MAFRRDRSADRATPTSRWGDERPGCGVMMMLMLTEMFPQDGRGVNLFCGSLKTQGAYFTHLCRGFSLQRDTKLLLLFFFSCPECKLMRGTLRQKKKKKPDAPELNPGTVPCAHKRNAKRDLLHYWRIVRIERWITGVSFITGPGPTCWGGWQQPGLLTLTDDDKKAKRKNTITRM